MLEKFLLLVQKISNKILHK